MKLKKVFLRLSLASLIILGARCVNEATTDHTKDLCASTKILHALDMKDQAYQHQTKAINNMREFNARYIDKVVTSKKTTDLRNNNDSNNKDVVELNDKYFLWIDYEENRKTTISATREQYIEIYDNDNNLLDTLKIR